MDEGFDIADLGVVTEEDDPYFTPAAPKEPPKHTVLRLPTPPLPDPPSTFQRPTATRPPSTFGSSRAFQRTTTTGRPRSPPEPPNRSSRAWFDWRWRHAAPMELC